eukprot:gnl/MRDRNA2_/MRDRNA2_82322_c0_seq9.p1 gnl/MRDRNA2_/MRDRNA2_82322_c0~~gnl/MRDRNA2_/MRDRNA2_82322_c0_seq9.p1  ORF type:complete len:205 (-),score=35.64 gnl/MRDRNA2_/MRDRNA2_82322_c0_seq9:363-977(-)
MMKQVKKTLIVFAALSDMAWSLKMQTSHAEVPEVPSSKYSGPTAHIFFINLNQDKERCKCVTSQLHNAPYPVTRIEAQTPETMFTNCWDMYAKQKEISEEIQMELDRSKSHKTLVEGALYCSNYLTWKHFYENSHAEFALIMEDDIILKNSFWDYVQGLLGSNCSSRWNYITVDPEHRGVQKNWKLPDGATLGQNATCPLPLDV